MYHRVRIIVYSFTIYSSL